MVIYDDDHTAADYNNDDDNNNDNDIRNRLRFTLIYLYLPSGQFRVDKRLRDAYIIGF